jgi:hypothetical protein
MYERMEREQVRVGGAAGKTSVKMRTLHPVWDEALALEVRSGGDVLGVTVYDWDALGANDPLGALSLPLAHLFPAALDPAAAAAAAASGEQVRATLRRWWALDAVEGAGGAAGGGGGSGGAGHVELELVYDADADFARGARADVLLHYVCAAVAARDADTLEERLMEAREAEVGGHGPGTGAGGWEEGREGGREGGEGRREGRRGGE